MGEHDALLKAAEPSVETGPDTDESASPDTPAAPESTCRLVGPTVVAAALGAGRREFGVVYIDRRRWKRRLQRLSGLAHRRQVAVQWVDPDRLTQLAGGEGHGGVVAFAGPRPRQTVDELVAAAKAAPAALVLAIEGVEDPFNFGRLLRSAVGCGATGVLARTREWGHSEADLGRVSAGAYERVLLAEAEDLEAALQRLRSEGLTCVALVPGEGRPLYEADLRRPAALVVGGERRGLSKRTLRACDEVVFVPTARRTESLAACDAAAVALYEALRQRRRTGAKEK